MGEVRCAQGVFGVHDAQVLIDTAESLAADPSQSRDQKADDQLVRSGKGQFQA
jgi:hypothetical protein